MIEVGNSNKTTENKDIWNHYNQIPTKSWLGLIIVYPYFIWLKVLFCLKEKKKRINEFSIGYMINPKLNIYKSFSEQVNKCMKTTFGSIT